jgi:hypothetical protein
MATMRNRFNTWLKEDCHNVGISLIDTAETIEFLGKNAISGLKPDDVDKISNYIESDHFKPKKHEMSIVNAYITTIKERIKVNNESAYPILSEFVDYYKTLALEHTVECQCGKQTSNHIKWTFKNRDHALAVMNSNLENVSMEEQQMIINDAREYLKSHPAVDPYEGWEDNPIHFGQTRPHINVIGSKYTTLPDNQITALDAPLPYNIKKEEAILKEIFPEHGKVVNYIDSKGREVKLVARPIWTDYEDDKAYNEDLAAWESSSKPIIGSRVQIVSSGYNFGRYGEIIKEISSDFYEIKLDSGKIDDFIPSQFIIIKDESNLGGRITNPDASNTGSCTCTAGKEMCWKHGVQGTLTKDQKEDMCTIWNPIKQEGK